MLEQPISKAGWTRVALGDVAKNVNDYFDRDTDEAVRYIAGEHVDEGQLKVRRWGMTDDGFFPPTFKRKFKAGDALFHSRNIKKIAVPDFNGVTGEKLFVLRSKDDGVLMQEFLGFLLSSEHFSEYAIRNWSGSVNKFFNWKPLSQYEFLLPPIQEQARLVEAASACRTALDALQDAYAAALVAEAAYGKSVADSLNKTAPLVAIGNVADVQYGLTVNQKRAESTQCKPYLRVANVQRGAFDLSEMKEIGVFESDTVHELRPDDVLVVEGHAVRSEIGRAAIWQGEIPGALHQNHLIRIRASGDMLPRYICEMINSPHGQSYFQTRAKSSSGLNTINSSVVRDYRIPKPAVSEQQQVVSVFQSMSLQRGNLARRLADARKLYADLLSAISGRTA